MRAAERQNAAPLALESAYSSYSASNKRRSAAAIARSRGSFKSNGAPDTVHWALQAETDNIRNGILVILHYCIADELHIKVLSAEYTY